MQRSCGSTRCVLLVGTIWLGVLGALGSANAADATLCVASDGIPLSTCGGAACDLDGLASISDALAAAAVWPDQPDGRPSVVVCLAGSTPLHETVIVDNSATRLGAPFVLDLQAPLCPSPEADSSAPVLTWNGAWEGDGDEHDRLSLHVDRSPDGPCAASAGPGVLVADGGHLQIHGSVIRGTTGYALRSTGAPAPYLQVATTALLDGAGPAVWADGQVSMVESQVEGFLVGPSTGGAAVVLSTGPQAPLDLRRSALARNVIDSSDGVERSVVFGHAWRLERLYLGLNLLGGTSSAARLALAPRRLAFVDGSPTGTLPIDGVVFSRNARTLEVGLSPPAPSEVRDLSVVSLSCAGEDPGSPWAHDSPPAALESGDGPVLVVEPGIEDWQFAVARTFFVENQTGQSPVIEASVGPDATLSIVQSTFGGNGRGPVVALEGGQDGAILSLLRNLFVPAPDDLTPHELVSLATDPHGLTISGNAVPDGWSWAVPVQDSARWLVGPEVTLAPGSVLAGLPGGADDCERHLAICPDGASTDCLHWLGLDLPCPIDSAERLLLDPNAVDSFQDSWPWEGEWFVTGRSGWLLPGAQGGPCAPVAPPFDQAEGAAGADHGDGDGFVDAIDCDNEDPERIPLLPSLDGYQSPYCEEIADDCFTCPPDSLPPPSDDPDPEGNEGAGGSGTEVGCDANRGCGFSWNVSSLLIGLLVPLGVTRWR